MSDVNLHVNDIDFAKPIQLNLLLVSPSGETEIAKRAGCANTGSVTNLDLTFDQQAAQILAADCPSGELTAPRTSVPEAAPANSSPAFPGARTRSASTTSTTRMPTASGGSTHTVIASAAVERRTTGSRTGRLRSRPAASTSTCRPATRPWGSRAPTRRSGSSPISRG